MTCRGQHEAKRLGAALISQNIANILLENFQTQGKQLRILVYCWRGGERSQSLAHVLSRVGWEVAIVKRGYMGYRNQVLSQACPQHKCRPVECLHSITDCSGVLYCQRIVLVVSTAWRLVRSFALMLVKGTSRHEEGGECRLMVDAGAAVHGGVGALPVPCHWRSHRLWQRQAAGHSYRTGSSGASPAVTAPFGL